ncbi:Acyl-CoA synthetase family member 2, mitochondrial [Orchesella cincta]|uniref:Medium-chain acyl-CoA ligase ACSF2, mitochondrial n=1 Tax=Orchesella cincta TaxID=48709 RepID=A0A1D2MKW3_ORCCI|nr:Acyl-CoA synthetase family member 2, mitochondrial [Orchesella cincta]
MSLSTNKNATANRLNYCDCRESSSGYPTIPATCIPSTVAPYPKPGKQSYLSIPGAVPLSEMTIGNLVDRSASRFPDSPAIVVSTPTEVRKSYQEFKKEIDHLAAGLLKIGLQKGDRIGIWGPNSYEWYLTFLAVMKCGLILVHINPAYQTRELVYCLNKVGIKCMVIAEPFKSSNYYEMMLKTCPEIETADPGKISTKTAPNLTTLITIPSVQKKGAFTLEEILRAGSTPESLSTLEDVEKGIQFDDVCNIQFTSGTTGNPKGVMLTHHGLVNNAYFMSRRFGYNEQDKLCLPAPLFHCFPCCAAGLAAIHAGAALVLPSRGFSPSDALKAIAKEKCTAVYGTPTMHIDIINASGFEKYDMSSLKIAVTGGAICLEELIRQMKEKYTIERVVSCYGLTETSPVFFQTLVGDSDKLLSETVGYPHEHVEVKIVDTDGKVVEIGQPGEMCVRGYVVMRGYWEDPEKTAEAIDSSRWFHTGDVAVMNEGGYGRIVGRLKDMIIRGGENIYPREIEDFLHTHPDIQEAQIFSVPDFRMGEEVCAWLKLRKNTKVTGEDLKLFCKGKIAHYKIPRYIRLVNEFPKTTSGKIQKFKMRDEMMKELNIKKRDT